MAPETTIHRRRSTDRAGGPDAPDPAPDPDPDPDPDPRAPPGDADPRVSGPHAGYDRYGRLDHRFYRCERCGLESTDPGLRRGCPRCDGHDARGAPPGVDGPALDPSSDVGPDADRTHAVRSRGATDG